MLNLDKTEKEVAMEQTLKEEARNKKRERELSDVKAILELPEGRRFLWRVLSDAKVFASCFHEKESYMAYLEGRRDVGLFVLNELTSANKNALTKIQNEHFSESGKKKGSK